MAEIDEYNTPEMMRELKGKAEKRIKQEQKEREEEQEWEKWIMSLN